MKTIKFVQAFAPYMKDEVAGFADNEAEGLIKRGVAVEVKGPKGKKTDEDGDGETETKKAPAKTESKEVKGPNDK